jgi:hypothetical protein
MSKELKLFIRGVGVGLIIAAAFFYLTYFTVRQSDTFFVDDEVIIERARELGMDFTEESK